MHARRLVLPIGNSYERVAAASRGEPVVLFRHVDAVDARNARAALHTEQLHWLRRARLAADEHSRVTQRN